MESEVVTKNFKFEYCREELKVLCKKLIEGNYNLTAKVIFDHIANTGVEVDTNPKLKNQISFEEFVEEET